MTEIEPRVELNESEPDTAIAKEMSLLGSRAKEVADLLREGGVPTDAKLILMPVRGTKASLSFRAPRPSRVEVASWDLHGEVAELPKIESMAMVSTNGRIFVSDRPMHVVGGVSVMAFPQELSAEHLQSASDVERIRERLEVLLPTA